MPILTVRGCNDPILRKRSQPIADPSQVWTLAADMIATMRAERGAGLAAVQVGELKRLFVMADLPEEPGPPLSTAEVVLINPVIASHSAETMVAEEGCLSMPGVTFPVTRFTEVEVHFTKPTGERETMVARGYRAQCIQHEMDHLDGVRNLDYLSPLQRDKFIRKSAKFVRQKGQ